MSNPCKLNREEVNVNPYGFCTACGYKVFDHVASDNQPPSSEEDFIDHGTHWERKTHPPKYRPMPSPDNAQLHKVIWDKVKERQGKSTALIANEIVDIISTHSAQLVREARIDTLTAAIESVKEEIKATRENLSYHRNTTKNARLANEWHCTLMGEQWCLRNLKKQLAQLTSQKGTDNE